MAIHPQFPNSPHLTLDPEIRWFPADEALRQSSYEKLLPPLVYKVRKQVQEWRNQKYLGASPTSIALLNWWFHTPHPQWSDNGSPGEFRYYFSQQEAIESLIFLLEVARVKDKYDLIRFDSSGAVSAGMFDEEWRRLVIKMATGSGKTKIISLVLTWCYFHKLYEAESDLATNFLIIAPNIIVLDRLRTDFDGLKIFQADPLIPDDGWQGQNWRDDFHLTFHIQDDVRILNKTGNVFLTNIHRVYAHNEKEPSLEDEDLSDYFLGKRPTGKTTDSKMDLGNLLREVDELVIINDEAHHIHDPKLAWFKSIEDIHNRLKQKDRVLSLQIDVTATPKHNNGAIFVQTIADYPLVEAIFQNVIKHPVLPDAASRAKLVERPSSLYTEKYADYIHLGVEEWRKSFNELEKMGKKSVLFIMTDDTKNCDDVAVYLEKTYPEFQNGVLVIHTKNNGEISEAGGSKDKDELDRLRKASRNIDSWESPYKAIVSVLVLKEGWDVRNVTTIVGLRPYSAKSNILPEQTLGRGLRRMFPEEPVEEYVSIVGTPAFMDFVESIKSEGVELERKPMGEGSAAKTPLIIEVDNQKDLDKLDIEIPVMTARVYREYKNLEELNPANFGVKKLPLLQFTEAEKREIIFKDITTGEINHTTLLESATVADPLSIIGHFTHSIMKELRLISGYAVLFGQVKEFILNHLFIGDSNLEDLNTLRNLSELVATKTIIETFKKKINELTIKDKGSAQIRDTINLKKVRPFVVKDQGYLFPKKSLFNKIIGDSQFELDFACFLEECPDIIAYAKNYMAVHFKLDYVNASGEISNYYPDFFVKIDEKTVVIVETKGLEDLDVPLKMARLKEWCADINKEQKRLCFDFVFVEEEEFKKYNPNRFQDLKGGFKKYK